MPSLFAEHMIDVRKAVDEQFGEEVLIIPRVEGNPYLVGAVDNTIGSYTLIGVARISNAILRVAGTRYKAKKDATLSGTCSEVTFNTDEFTTARPAPRSGWHMQLTGRAEQPILRISYARTDGAGRMHCSVELIDSDGNT